jgi:hypothetical protein
MITVEKRESDELYSSFFSFFLSFSLARSLYRFLVLAVGYLKNKSKTKEARRKKKAATILLSCKGYRTWVHEGKDAERERDNQVMKERKTGEYR